MVRSLHSSSKIESRVSFVIPELTPTNNKLIRYHWTIRRDLRRDFFYLMKLYSNHLDIPHAQPMEKRAVRIKSYRLQLADKDNLTGGMKMLLDALTDALYIFDDGPKFLDLDITQEQVKRRDEQRTEVSLSWWT